jgi:hypothetical protein
MHQGQIVTDGTHTYDEVLRGHTTEVREIARQARARVIATLPRVVEVCWPKQGIAGYGVGPRKMSEQFCYIALHQAHVNLGFYYGADLPDPSGLLDGTSKRPRHVKLRSAGELGSPDLMHLLRAASRHFPNLGSTGPRRE